MDELIEQKLNQVEEAFNNVIENITQNNPSESDALKLLQADREFDQAVQTLQNHQDNYSHIVRLRDEEKKLDDQIKSIVQSLAEVRKELKEAKFTEYTADAKRIPFDNLVRFAKDISRFTVPPTSAFPDPPPDEDPSNVERNVGWNTLSQDQQSWLDHFAKTPFVPWPNEEAIRAGALSGIQAMREQGQDPTVSFDANQPASTEIEIKHNPELSTLSKANSSTVQRPAFEGFSFD